MFIVAFCAKITQTVVGFNGAGYVVGGDPIRLVYTIPSKHSDALTPVDTEIDIWQTAPNGMYSSQDPDQGIHSFHGLMTADENGRYAFTKAKPVCYTVPDDGPVGEILRAAGLHPWRPSHLHYIVSAKGFRSLVATNNPHSTGQYYPFNIVSDYSL